MKRNKAKSTQCSRKASNKVVFEYSLKEVKEQTMPLSGRKVNQAEKTASTEVPISLLGMFKEW